MAEEKEKKEEAEKPEAEKPKAEEPKTTETAGSSKYITGGAVWRCFKDNTTDMQLGSAGDVIADKMSKLLVQVVDAAVETTKANDRVQVKERDIVGIFKSFGVD